MEGLLIGAFIFGGVAGIACPLNKDLLSSVGMIVMNIANLINPFSIMLVSGYFVAAFFHNMITSIMDSYKKEDEEYKWEIASYRAVNYVWNFLYTYGAAVIVFSIWQNSYFGFLLIMGYSLLKIVQDIYIFIGRGGKKGLIRRIIGYIFLLIAASMTINNVNSGWSTAGYFTVILAFNGVSRTKDEERHEKRLTMLDSLRFGSVGEETIGMCSGNYAAIILAQAIIWGSQKDSLGTLLNIALPGELEYFRLIWAILVGIIFWIVAHIAISNHKPKEENKKKEKKKDKVDSLIKYIVLGINLYLLIINLGLPFMLVLSIVGLIASRFLNGYHLRQFAVPVLLLVGSAG